MTSAISREDVKAQAYMAGIKDPVALRALLRVVDLYAFALARTMTPEVQQQVIDPWAHLAPGDSDLPGKVTRCISCEVVRGWRDFLIDESSATRHGNSCKGCGRKGKRGRRDAYLCRSCGESWPLGQFPMAKQESPHINMSCNHCGGQDMRRYRCVGDCRLLKPLSEFPQWKQDNPTYAAPCSYCAPRYTGSRRPPA